ncbi:Zn-dependent exopeptidase [Pluteus cervinus]|uniref:Zn-dependent exopeptidase n=1 Tax=Pluteus cervinus TaxID=181527 RepID=A0ACD3BBC8_9AGAR|nr:Zn-dependent exopeptidase [Pluteus cervinus]
MNFRLAALLALLGVALAAPISNDEIAEKSSQGLRLLSLGENVEPVWKSEDEKLDLMRKGIKFFDVTEVYELEQKLPKGKLNAVAAFPAISHQSAVNPLLSQISIPNMQANLATLTAYNNRYYRSSTGADSAAWILSTVKSIASASGRSDVTASAFTHSWVQSSTIAKIAGKTTGPVTILGAHMDSINLSNPTNGRAPGADDDGTGTVNLIEIFRVLVQSGFKPTTPVEFHWYSGEEAGLLGSQDIATSYKNARTQVKAFMELDMTGYYKPGSKEVMAIQADYIDDSLNTYLKSLITAYSRIPWTMDIACGYACSDHASWYKAGYPGTFPYEAVTGNDDPNVHSASDTTSITNFSWNHSVEFAKVGLAFVYELAI